MTRYACPCCGFMTMGEAPGAGTYDICPVCFWEDDPVQFEDPDFGGGANKESLRQSQQNFILFGACSNDMIKHVRKPNKDEIKDPTWSPLAPSI